MNNYINILNEQCVDKLTNISNIKIPEINDRIQLTYPTLNGDDKKYESFSKDCDKNILSFFYFLDGFISNNRWNNKENVYNYVYDNKLMPTDLSKIINYMYINDIDDTFKYDTLNYNIFNNKGIHTTYIESTDNHIHPNMKYDPSNNISCDNPLKSN